MSVLARLHHCRSPLSSEVHGMHAVRSHMGLSSLQGIAGVFWLYDKDAILQLDVLTTDPFPTDRNGESNLETTT